MESDHHGFDQRHADSKSAPSGGCYYHPFVRRELATDNFRSRGRANFSCLFCWQDDQTGCHVRSVGCVGGEKGGTMQIDVSSSKCNPASHLAEQTAHSQVALQEALVPVRPGNLGSKSARCCCPG